MKKVTLDKVNLAKSLKMEARKNFFPSGSGGHDSASRLATRSNRCS